jgi:hypothetical protein
VVGMAEKCPTMAAHPLTVQVSVAYLQRALGFHVPFWRGRRITNVKVLFKYLNGDDLTARSAAPLVAVPNDP